MNLLVIGANGQVGSEIKKVFATTDDSLIAWTRTECDCSQIHKVSAALSRLNPDLIINAAAYTAVDKAEDEVQLAHRVNADFVQELALYCDHKKIPLIHLSTDYVFDGAHDKPYKEHDTPNPQTVYGQSKLAGEEAIKSHLEHYIILRVSWVFGVYGTNFVKTILRLGETRTQLSIVADQKGRPTGARDIARVLLELVQKIKSPLFQDWGIYHYAGKGESTWYEFSCFFVEQAKKKGKRLTLQHIQPIPSEAYVTKAVRPKNSVLNTEKIEERLGIHCHSWMDYLDEVIE